MTTPDLLTTVGFKKSKIGSGDKELGYVIKKNRLSGIIACTAACVCTLSFIIVMVLFEVHFEKRSFRRQLRKEEHHAASKLAQVEMELWSQYRDDIQESNEAHTLLRSLNASYDHFQMKLQAVVNQASTELTLDKIKAAHLADRILHLVADMQKDNVKHVKHLVDHLVDAGKRSVKLERHVGKDILKDLGDEERLMKEAMEEGGDVPAAPVANESSEDEPLKAMLEGFWFTFNDYEGEFKGEARDKLKDGNPTYEALKQLHANITGPSPPSEDEVIDALDGMDLKNVGAGLGSGRALPAADIVEELTLIPKIPHVELAELERAWRAGEKDAVTVFGQLAVWHREGVVPSGWLQMGVRKEEDEEEREEREIDAEELAALHAEAIE